MVRLLIKITISSFTKPLIIFWLEEYDCRHHSWPTGSLLSTSDSGWSWVKWLGLRIFSPENINLVQLRLSAIFCHNSPIILLLSRSKLLKARVFTACYFWQLGLPWLEQTSIVRNRGHLPVLLSGVPTSDHSHRRAPVQAGTSHEKQGVKRGSRTAVCLESCR